ncbi:GvpL/GvpF family gas vesicle protein [Streptomyces sp. NPDC008222]|uniref:GvpL/GvpF family gas vesicle protein n=1 Tax=Streptomyces sp. NPDC008222 TaxID=3364820 RepID=UPI0036E51570
MDDRLCYAYAVVGSSAAAELTGVRGVAGAPVTLVRSGPVAAAVSAVPREGFSEAALKAGLEDLEWLEATARAHHSVIEALAAHTTVLPLRLATVYLDEARVRQMLDDREADLAALLDRLADQVEWGVKVYAEVPPPSAPSAPPPAADTGAAAGAEAGAEAGADAGGAEAGAEAGADAGRAYLRRRRHQRQAREDAWRTAEEAVRRTELQARGLAVERTRHRPQQGGLTRGVAGENVANDAYLVPRRLSEEFRTRMLHAADDLPGVRVDVTGPWAPYSFAAPLAPDAQEGAGQR